MNNTFHPTSGSNPVQQGGMTTAGQAAGQAAVPGTTAPITNSSIRTGYQGDFAPLSAQGPQDGHFPPAGASVKATMHRFAPDTKPPLGSHRAGQIASHPAPLNVQHVPEGGVAIDGKSGLAMGYPKSKDNVIGKIEKTAGKLTGNWDIQERGELRDAGGKLAAKGLARAPHD